MKHSCFLIFLFIISFMACKVENIEESSNIVFLQPYTEVALIKKTTCNFREIMQHEPFNLLFDQVEKKIWIHTVVDGKSNFQYLEENGTLSECIVISYQDIEPTVGGGPYICNNIALISSVGEKGLKHILVNLIDKSYSVIEMNSDDFLFKCFIGFSGDYIFGEDWCYDITLKEKKVFSKKLFGLSYMAEIDKLIGIDDNGDTILLDYRTDTYETLPIKKRRVSPDRFWYNQGDLFYANNDYIYYSEYSKWYPVVFHFTYFMKAEEPRKWYRYNRNTGENIKIASPTEFDSILGVFGND